MTTMTTTFEEVHTQGRVPTAENIQKQKAEQVAATLALRSLLSASHKLVNDEQREHLRRLCRARGLPTR
jgi:hypothetical protein